jgi:tight adherence protein B
VAAVVTGLLTQRPRRRLTTLYRPSVRADRRKVELSRVPNRLVLPVAAGVAGLLGGVGAGPVAAALAAAYVAGGVALAQRHSRASAAARTDAGMTDAVADLAAELRAGAPPMAVAAALEATPAAIGVAWRVSEQTGAPLAEVLDRVEAELRQAQRIGLTVAAHRAGVRATALLLALLPAGGMALGYGIGSDPLAVLTSTPLGAGCAVLACALQFAGVWWTERLSRVDVQ